MRPHVCPRSEARVRRHVLTLAIMMALAATISAGAQMPKNVLRLHQTQVRLITTPNGLVTAVVGGKKREPRIGRLRVLHDAREATGAATQRGWTGNRRL